MSADEVRESLILGTYLERTPGSARRHEEARALFPSGIVHDARRTWPYGLYMDRALGARKWDVDGNEYVDYHGGHGALLLGHQHPEVVAAAQAQLAKGMHFAAGHDLMLEWGRLIQQLMPSAERIRFTSSGTEATHLAIRLARASSGKGKLLRFTSHFHGWHDHVAFGVKEHFDGTPTVGVLPDVASNVILVKPNDVEAIDRVLGARDDVAAVIIEPVGASSGAIPTRPAVLKALREITRRHGVLLIFDEVVTGFRIAPGGAQQLYDVKPDITTMAKIVAGGLPGGAVGGRKDILDWLDYEASSAAGREKIAHEGTHNAHPVSAAAGIATLKIIRDSDACERASAAAAKLRAGFNAILEEERVPWVVYGVHSFFNFFTNPEHRPLRPTTFDAEAVPVEWFKPDKRERLLAKMRLSMLVQGIDLKSWRGGIVSAAHSQADIDWTLDAWRKTLRALKSEGDLPRGDAAR
ncbi:MAG: aminotransferase class III-fold pyridoxal phosphate-dependent enzyme [Burkholderiales bacterium]|nr:aminotransferase class III-fold pyridoxal phosphate-dependent enzyme [Burkholderiales bacterium]